VVPAAISEQDTCYHIKAGNPWFAFSLCNSSCNSYAHNFRRNVLALARKIGWKFSY